MIYQNSFKNNLISKFDSVYFNKYYIFLRQFQEQVWSFCIFVGVITYGILCDRSDSTVLCMDLCIIILQLSINYSYNFLYLCFYLSVKPA
jgi:hypothetical protein